MQSCFIPGPAGRIETVVSSPKGYQADTIPTLFSSFACVGILCHPHPLHLGSLRNKVVTTLHKSIQTIGWPTVRFNFRGVGDSQGAFDHAKGECEDLLAVMHWVQSHAPEMRFILGGFSFGSYIAHHIASQYPDKVQALLTLAPVVERYDFTSQPRPQCPQLIIHGEEDEIASVAHTRHWYTQYRSHTTQLIIMPHCSHFFHGQLVTLRDHIEEFLKKCQI